ncbi:hypothetical protein Tco_1056538 [Tanacetum coccineum]|uniref:Uncharacterized protein n=1 Tax=Tanacetum coccineum TaxID=301880 RepID=A0ABQ5H3W8_9ASTR
MSTPSNNSQMHNDIMAAGSRKRPSMLALVDACSTAREIWLAIKHLQQGESINKQDVKTKLLWEFGKFNSKDGESIESYYSRFYKMINEMVRNKLKQHQNEANEIRAEKIAKNANPLALVTAAQHYLDNYSPDTYHQALKTHKPYAPSSRQTLLIRYHDPTKTKGKELAKPITPPSESPSKEKDLPDVEPLEKLQFNNDYNVFANDKQHSEQPKSIKNTCVMESIESNVTPNSSNMCDNECQDDKNAKVPEDEHVMLASLIANFKLDLDVNKKSQRQLKKANTSITQELNKSKQDLEKIKQDLEKSKQDIEKTKQDLEISKQNLTYSKSELEKYIMFQTNHQDKEKVELKCARALGLLEHTKPQHHEYSKTQLLKTFCVKEENAKLLTKISAYESRIS